ncbi:diacylglycerol/lipid kinase family protein [Pseudosulfitobacter koreensis]|uniref:DAGKc domain-containing protein n=1 Tax=Pseudosulfitobacter koreensis TaxID=2968472 RepID=A0ABT1YZQ5_9RHOB|nr:diacylglycerol kinase family protein [Pseudosulfitobacter koreense]MCR8826370.1 hypothetical protein [Pseudosulfitobacter koreense]
MRVLLLHNPTAGSGDHSRERLTRLLASRGHTVSYRDIKSDGITPKDASEVDLIAIAGGDGTVGKAFRAFIDADRPFAIIPLGTANNVARSLNVPLGAEDGFGWLDGAEECQIDVGVARGPWGTRLFFEAVGIGPLAEMMQAGKAADFNPEEKQHFGAEAPQRLVRDAYPQDWQVRADGQDLSGDMILLEVLNMPITGPNLPLGPSGCFDDGRLCLSILRAPGQESFAHWLAGSRERPATGLERLNAKRVELVWKGEALRIDDDLPEPPDEAAKVVIALAPQKLRVLIPKENGGV